MSPRFEKNLRYSSTGEKAKAEKTAAVKPERDAAEWRYGLVT